MRRILAVVLLALIGTIGFYHGPAQGSVPPVLRLGTEGSYAPWNFTNPDGSLGGFEIGLAADLCRRMHVKCTFVSMDFAGLIPALNAGKIDAIVDDMSITPKREEAIAFSVPYAALCDTFATLKTSPLANLPGTGEVISLDSEPQKAAQALDAMKPLLQGKAIGVTVAGVSYDFVNKYLAGVVQVRTYQSLPARNLDLNSGRVDIINADKSTLLGEAKKPGNEAWTIVGPCFEGGVIGKGSGVGLRKTDTDLKALFDRAIRAAKADGTITRLSLAVFGFDVSPK